MKKKWIVTSIIALTMMSGALVGPIMSDVEKPDYQIIASEKNIEMRRYAPMIIAEVKVEGEREDAISNGFRFLADYIFGNNTVQQHIAMTAPVQQQSSVDAWRISFVMPSAYSMETLPKPNNTDLKLKEIPAKQYIVLQFHGTNSNGNIAKHEKQLIHYIKANKIKTVASPKYAFYNPPWTLPFMRRNEIMIEIEPEK